MEKNQKKQKMQEIDNIFLARVALMRAQGKSSDEIGLMLDYSAEHIRFKFFKKLNFMQEEDILILISEYVNKKYDLK